MKIDQCRLLIEAKDVRHWLRSVLEENDANNPSPEADWSLVGVELKDNILSVAASRRMCGGVRIPFELGFAIRPTQEGSEVVIEVVKVSAAHIGVSFIRSLLPKFVSQSFITENNCRKLKSGISIDIVSIAARYGLDVSGQISEISISTAGVLIVMSARGDDSQWTL